jgi:hypothetical protein
MRPRPVCVSSCGAGSASMRASPSPPRWPLGMALKRRARLARAARLFPRSAVGGAIVGELDRAPLAVKIFAHAPRDHDRRRRSNAREAQRLRWARHRPSERWLPSRRGRDRAPRSLRRPCLGEVRGLHFRTLPRPPRPSNTVFGIEIDGERRTRSGFNSIAEAEQAAAGLVAQGRKVAIFDLVTGKIVKSCNPEEARSS